MHERWVDTVKIDNAASMMLAVQYLHSKYGSVPGLLTTPVTVGNFTERRFAYEHAIGQLSGSEKCGTIHELAVAPDEAYAGMLDIIDSGEPLAQNYVAVFDDIAIGAMKALSSVVIARPMTYASSASTTTWAEPTCSHN